MKQYLILLRSSDFSKEPIEADSYTERWTSSPINLYANSQYNNYSSIRSGYGIDIIGDRTFVGTEVTSPSGSFDNATPLTNRAVYTTNYGEVVSDSATPQLFRFIDTTSRIDILSYRHVFTNIPGDAYPSFNITMYEGDTANGPWLQTVLSGESGAIFNKDCKQFLKIQLDIFSDGLDLNTVGLVFYLEVGIHDPVSPVISRNTRDILRRFPSWTALFEDSIEQATPEIAVPKSVGGKFLNALVQQDLDNIERHIDLQSINSFITTANIDQLAWCFSVDGIPSSITSAVGDGVQLARMSSIVSFLESRPNDYVFYYSPVDRQLLTLREFQELRINDEVVNQEAVNVFNDFDEFGARVSLPRLYLESNENYKKRILDVAANPPASSLDGFKRTVRRELDLWRAYGATPDSGFPGATPIVFEISDLENSVPFFSPNGVAGQPFRTLVDNINERFPSNFGYVKWDETVWDYGGLELEGLGRLSAQYDVDNDLVATRTQNGVGDIDDIKVSVDPVDAATINFNGYIKISGSTSTNSINVYPPVIIDYKWYFQYRMTVADFNASLARSAVVYEVDLPPHDNYSTPTTFYANLNYNTSSIFTVGNEYMSTHPSSPEFNIVPVFDGDGMSIVDFRDKVYNTEYRNTQATPASSRISLYDASAVRVVFKRTWNQASQAYQTIPTDSFRFAFNNPSPVWVSSPTAGGSVSIASPNINSYNSNLLIGSNLYPTTLKSFNSDPFYGQVVLNSINDMSAKTSENIYTADLMRNNLMPVNATLDRLIVDVVRPQDLSLNGQTEISNLIGGRSYNPQSDMDRLVPSSPNIIYRPYNSAGAPLSAQSFFESATLNFGSTPHYLQVSTLDGSYYPFSQNQFTNFTAQSTPNLFSGFIDENNNTYKNASETVNVFFNQDTFLENASVSKSSFGLNAAKDYVVTGIEYITDTEDVVVSSSENSVIINDLNSKLNNNISATLPIYAERASLNGTSYRIGVNSGWMYFGEEEYYMYYEPIVQSLTGKFFSIPLSDSPKMGAPIIVEVGATPYRNVVFEDAATPGRFSFTNTEVVSGNGSNKLYLAYKNIRNANVVDKFTGQTLFTNISTTSNEIEPFSSATPSILGREYEVTYYINDAFHVEKDVFNESTNSFSSILYLSATPSSNVNYKITYEGSNSPKPRTVAIDINQVENPLSEGFIYASLTSYPFSHVEAHLSPKFIIDSNKEYMSLTITALDVNGNSKPGQSFAISGSNVTVTPSIVTVNENGFGLTKIRYTGPIPATADSSTITIQGLSHPTQGAGPNSSAQGYQTALSFSIIKKARQRSPLEVKAIPYRYNINADAQSRNTILGQIFWEGKPLPGVLTLTWAKARTLYDLFEKVNTYVAGGDVNTNAAGEFEIANAITAGSSNEPGYWFASIEIKTPSQVAALVLSSDPTAFNDGTVDISAGAGDIIYWYEEYDNVHFINEYTPLPNVFTHTVNLNSEIISTPNFVYSHTNPGELIDLTGIQNWRPPHWVLLRGYDKSQSSSAVFDLIPTLWIDATESTVIN